MVNCYSSNRKPIHNYREGAEMRWRIHPSGFSQYSNSLIIKKYIYVRRIRVLEYQRRSLLTRHIHPLVIAKSDLM